MATETAFALHERNWSWEIRPFTFVVSVHQNRASESCNCWDLSSFVTYHYIYAVLIVFFL